MANANQKGKATVEKAADDKAAKTYITNRTVSHDQEQYGQGEDIVLTEKQAAPLLAIDAIRDPDDTGDQA